MNIDKFLQLFVVKEKRFYPLFLQSAENIKKAAELLVNQTKTDDPDQRRILAHRIKECETEGDRITDKIVDEILDAFVTPFDRDDIHQLAEGLDSVIDAIRDSSKKIAIYQPKECTPKLIEIAEYIYRISEIFIEITVHFETMRSDAKALDSLCDKIKDIEHIVDDVYEQYMSNLFATESDAIELIKKKNIVQALEDTTDIAKVVSNTIRDIVVKMG